MSSVHISEDDFNFLISPDVHLKATSEQNHQYNSLQGYTPNRQQMLLTDASSFHQNQQNQPNQQCHPYQQIEQYEQFQTQLMPNYPQQNTQHNNQNIFYGNGSSSVLSSIQIVDLQQNEQNQQIQTQLMPNYPQQNSQHNNQNILYGNGCTSVSSSIQIVDLQQINQKNAKLKKEKLKKIYLNLPGI
jgi:hypothetical protein